MAKQLMNLEPSLNTLCGNWKNSIFFLRVEHVWGSSTGTTKKALWICVTQFTPAKFLFNYQFQYLIAVFIMFQYCYFTKES